MVEPVSMSAGAAALMAAGQGAQGLGGYFAAKEQGKAAKKQAKEMKRKTLADLLNAALNREFEAGEGMRKRGGEMATARASALQNIASQYVQALR